MTGDQAAADRAAPALKKNVETVNDLVESRGQAADPQDCPREIPRD